MVVVIGFGRRVDGLMCERRDRSSDGIKDGKSRLSGEEEKEGGEKTTLPVTM